jgi:hypothetical protein
MAQTGMKKSKRILVGKMERNSKRGEISHDEIAQAIRRFKEDGGLIKELPPQRQGHRPLVGSHLGSAFESVIEH